MNNICNYVILLEFEKYFTKNNYDVIIQKLKTNTLTLKLYFVFNCQIQNDPIQKWYFYFLDSYTFLICHSLIFIMNDKKDKIFIFQKVIESTR